MRRLAMIAMTLCLGAFAVGCEDNTTTKTPPPAKTDLGRPSAAPTGTVEKKVETKTETKNTETTPKK